MFLLFRVYVFLCLCSSSIASWAQPAPKVHRKVYIHPQGNDKALGSLDAPLASLTAGVDLVHQWKKDNYKGKVELILAGGTYYLDKSVLIDASLSGTAHTPFVIRAADGQKVVLNAGAKLENLSWQQLPSGIWQTPITKGRVIEDLYTDNTKLIKARYPNYDSSVKPFNGYAKDAIAPERVKTWENPAGAYVHALHIGRWGGFHYRVVDKDKEGNLTLEGGQQNNRPSPMHETYRYVENVREELDAPHEWFYDEKQAVLYYMPIQGQNPNDLHFEAAQLENSIHIQGSLEKPAKHIHIQGIDFVHNASTFMKTSEPLLRSDWTIYRQGALLLEYTENCQVSDANFYNLGGNAIFLSNYNRHATIEGNLIENIGGSAVSFVGDPAAVRSPSFRYEEFVDVKDLDKTAGPQTNNYPANCSVANNLIRNIGLVEKQVAGVQIAMAMSIAVQHNTIYNMPRAGINVGDGTWGGHDIAYNDVFNTVLETSDHGAFNSWGRDRFWHPNRNKMDQLTDSLPELILLDAVKTTLIRNNRFRCDHGWDIDLDDGSSNYRIYNNLCLNGGIKLREGFYRTVYNNITLNNGFHPHVWFKDSKDVFKNNLVMLPHADIQLYGQGDTVDYNYYVNAAHLAEDRAKGWEKNATVISPSFNEPTTGDFTLIANVPAGFQNFPMDQFGVQAPRLQKIAAKPTIPALNFDTEEQERAAALYQYKGVVMKSVQTLGEQSAAGLPTIAGVMIVELAKGNSLKIKGLQVNDVIVGLDNYEIKNSVDLDKLLRKYNYKEEFRVTLYRNQEKQNIQIRM